MATTKIAAGCAHALGLTLLLAALAGCGERQVDATGAAPSPSAGQVAPTSAAPKASFYAASRFAEQVSFGPTPALVAELQAKGFEAWIDEQMALPASKLDVAVVAENAPGSMPEKHAYVRAQFGTYAMTAPDQLRLRMSWSLSQFLVASGTNTGRVTWFNLLQDHAFGNYATLLRAISVDPTMGDYLDNVENRPKSASCPTCAPNENYARELMQLFSLGVVVLNDDGTPKLGTRGQILETYTQSDVENLARVLTGWQFDMPVNIPEWYELRYLRPLLPSPLAADRDRGAKRVMGRDFPAGQSHDKDLDDTVAMLMAHPNIAPFISLRLIQHLVTSDPSPAYMRRVVAVFRNNGRGVAGDLRAVLKAVLLDEEARRGDVPGLASTRSGKYREPYLWYWAFFRALGCQRSMVAPRNDGLDPYWMLSQNPLGPPSVFGYYQATDRSPGSNLLAPEQKMITADEMQQRTYQLSSFAGRTGTEPSMLERSGCDTQALARAYAESPRAFNSLLGQRFLRGVMPPTLGMAVASQMYDPGLQGDTLDSALNLLAFALLSPYFAVMP